MIRWVAQVPHGMQQRQVRSHIPDCLFHIADCLRGQRELEVWPQVAIDEDVWSHCYSKSWDSGSLIISIEAGGCTWNIHQRMFRCHLCALPNLQIAPSVPLLTLMPAGCFADASRAMTLALSFLSRPATASLQSPSPYRSEVCKQVEKAFKFATGS